MDGLGRSHKWMSPQTRLTGVNQPIDFTCILMPHKCDRPEKRATQGTPYNYVILQGLTYLADVSSMQKLYVNSSHFFVNNSLVPWKTQYST